MTLYIQSKPPWCTLKPFPLVLSLAWTSNGDIFRATSCESLLASVLTSLYVFLVRQQGSPKELYNKIEKYSWNREVMPGRRGNISFGVPAKL